MMSDALDRMVRLRLSTHALRTIEHRGGLDAFLLQARDQDLSQEMIKLKRQIRRARVSA
jgi:large subunit ribosomal protein L28